MIRFSAGRPPRGQRRFESMAVEAAIERVSAGIANRELAAMFAQCLPNALDTAVFFTDGEVPDTFVITGDINAMWLRDSTAQVWPYLRFVNEDARLARLIEGVVRRQTRCLHIDVYANAFERRPGGSPWHEDLGPMHPQVHERKWELDSVCAAIRLAHGYWRATGDASPLDDDWACAMHAVLAVMREQQDMASAAAAYRFARKTTNVLDNLLLQGAGWPSRRTGLVRSAFRPSDDACLFPFHVPSNFMAAGALGQLAAMASATGRTTLAADAKLLQREVKAALDALPVPWPYEIDGHGNALHMDDANVPSLLSLPYLGACVSNDPRYIATRARVLGPHNPWFVRGRVAQGVGSPHTPLGHVWPMSIVMCAMTSDDDAEITTCLAQLQASHAGTGFMHESFDADETHRYTRAWFGWANSLFAELILTLADERPALLKGTARSSWKDSA
jgi:uncharacterized protein